MSSFYNTPITKLIGLTTIFMGGIICGSKLEKRIQINKKTKYRKKRKRYSKYLKEVAKSEKKGEYLSWDKYLKELTS